MEITQIKENCLYVNDLQKTREFYEGILRFQVISYDADRHIFFRAGHSVLLCFLPEVTMVEMNLPSHYAFGHQHLAFEVPSDQYQIWKNSISKNNIDIIHEQYWKEGLYSFYFHDPDQHLLEIVPPGIWE